MDFMLIFGVTIILAVLGLAAKFVPIALMLNLGLIVIGLTWLLFTIRLPWNSYFDARRGRQRAEKNKEEGIEVNLKSILELSRLEKRLLLVAIGVHFGSGGAVYGISQLFPDLVDPNLGWLFVISVLARPLIEAHAYVRQRIYELTEDVNYPKDNVATLLRQVEEYQHVSKHNESQIQRLFEDHELLTRDMSENVSRQDDRIIRAETRESENNLRISRTLDTLGRKIDEVVVKHSDNAELVAALSALKAFWEENGKV